MGYGITKYVKKAEESFSEREFGSADALALSWLSYFNYPDRVSEREGIRLEALQRLDLPENMYADAFNPKKSRKLFRRMCLSPRFGGIELSDYVNERDERDFKQFVAVCMRLTPERYFLSFRGTDPSFVGWKENFDLVYRYPVPSQTAALEYARRLMAAHPTARFIFGGHSKGGNIAVYAAAKLEPEYAERIDNVYNFDGPGFLKNTEFLRAQKTVPVASFVGMLLERGNDFSIVKSKNLSLLQHDPFSWRIKHGRFVRASRRSDSSVRLERSLNRWISDMSLSERERMVTIVYTALDNLDTHDFNVFFKTILKQARALGRAHRNLNPDDKKFFDTKIKVLKYILKHYK